MAGFSQDRFPTRDPLIPTAPSSVRLLITTGDRDVPIPEAAEGLVTKPCTHSVDGTLDRLEAALKESGVVVFTRLDHAAAAQSVGLEMPRSTVLVSGDPRAGTPVFIQHPTLATNFPLTALVQEDADAKVWLSYNSSEWTKAVCNRHGVPTNPEGMARTDDILNAGH